MQSSLRQVLTRLRRFKVMFCERYCPLADGRLFVGALGTLNDSSKKEVMVMLKVGDKIVVSVKVTQIIEDKNGVRFMVEPLSGDYYQSMKVTKEDIKSIVE